MGSNGKVRILKNTDVFLVKDSPNGDFYQASFLSTQALLTREIAYETLVGTPVLAKVATSGSYTDLSDLPVVAGGPTPLVNLLSGQAISAGMAVMCKPDGKVWKFDVSDLTHYGASVGIAKQAASGAGEAIDIYLPGGVAVDVGAGWTAGSVYYVSTSSTLTTTPPAVPNIVKLIGVGVGTDQVLISNIFEVISVQEFLG